MPVTGKRSASRRSVDIFWTNQLSLKSPDQGSGQQSSDQPAEGAYTVEVNVSSGGGQSPSRSVKYKVGRKDPKSGEMKQALTIWDWNPNAEYKVTVEGDPVNLEQRESSISPEYLREVGEFENKQAEWVCHPRDSNIAWLDGLQAQSETLQQEIGRMGAELKENRVTLKDDIRKMGVELKENHVTLKDDIRKADDRMGQQVDSVQEMTKYCKQSKSVFEKIDGNMEKLNTFIQVDCARIAKEKKTTKKNLQTVKEEKKEAEEKRKEADEKRKEADEKRKEADEKRKEADEKRKEADEKRKEAEEKRKEAEEKKKDAERALEEMKKNWTQEKERMQAEIRQAREKHELELQAVREEQQGVVHGMLQQQETLQREQHLAMQQMLQQVGQLVSATRPAPGVGESGDTQ
ncbi:hypothetical protein ACOMHN_029328 [Nucella lapillus]